MRLAEFIATNVEKILADWVEFARTVGTGPTMDLTTLRDHAEEMLKAVAVDLRAAQSDAQQHNKSKGLAIRVSEATTGAEYHGAGRAESGFSIQEMVAEFRALRASVLRLWKQVHPASTAEDIDDIVRFNEAIDQALSESLGRYEHDLNRSKEMFIAMLGHDLRTPLSAVLMGSQLMSSMADVSPKLQVLTDRLLRSAEHMNNLVDDLLDFTKTRIGSGLPLSRSQFNLHHELNAAMEEISTAKPEYTLELTTSGDLEGRWDATRMRQVFTNLLGNAAQYGTPATRIQISAHGDAREIVLSVHNFGETIEPARIAGIFAPFKRLGNTAASEQNNTTNLGLGLYITERIVSAHGGSIEVSSSTDAGTEFVIHLPR